MGVRTPVPDFGMRRMAHSQTVPDRPGDRGCPGVARPARYAALREKLVTPRFAGSSRLQTFCS